MKPLRGDPDSGSARRRTTHGLLLYGAATLALAGTAALLAGGQERALGIAAAWSIQLAAVWPLGRALASGRRLTKAWLGGLALRAGGFVVTAALSWTGVASRDLPAAYGLAMVALLIAEACWLLRESRRPSAR